MSFVGSFNQDLRAVLAELAPSWRAKPVYVGCSGNLTVERILAANGVTELHGNDVSLYSCVLGSFAAGMSSTANTMLAAAAIGAPIKTSRRTQRDRGRDWARCARRTRSVNDALSAGSRRSKPITSPHASYNANSLWHWLQLNW